MEEEWKPESASLCEEDREKMIEHLKSQAQHCVAVSESLLKESEGVKVSGKNKMQSLLKRNLDVASELEKIVGLLTEDGILSIGSASIPGSPCTVRSNKETKILENIPAIGRAGEKNSPFSPGYYVADSPRSCLSVPLEANEGVSRRKEYEMKQELIAYEQCGSPFSRTIRGLDHRREIEENLVQKLVSLRKKLGEAKRTAELERRRSIVLAEEISNIKRENKTLEEDLRRAVQTREDFGRILEDETKKAWGEFEEAKRSHDQELKQMRQDYSLAREQLKRANMEVDELRAKLKAQANSLENKSTKLEHSLSQYQRDAGDLKIKLQSLRTKAEALERENAKLKATHALQDRESTAQIKELELAVRQAKTESSDLREELRLKSRAHKEQVKKTEQAEEEREQERKAVASLRAGLEALKAKLDALDREKSRISSRASVAEHQAQELEDMRNEHITRAQMFEAQLTMAKKQLEAALDENSRLTRELETCTEQLRETSKAKAKFEEQSKRGAAALDALQTVTKDLYKSRNNALKLLYDKRGGCDCDKNKERYKRVKNLMEEELARTKETLKRESGELIEEIKLACEKRCSRLSDRIKVLQAQVQDQAATIHQLSCS